MTFLRWGEAGRICDYSRAISKRYAFRIGASRSPTTRRWKKAGAALQTKCRAHSEPVSSFGLEVSMTPEEFRSFYPRLIAWITQMLGAHEAAAKPVASLGFVRLSQ